MDAIAGKNLADDVLLIGAEMKALRAGIGQESDWAGDGRALAYPWLYLWMKQLGERAGIRALADDVVLRIEETGFGQEGLGFFVLAEEAGFAGLLHEFGDVALMGDGIGLGVVAVGGVELDGLIELNLRAGKIVVVEEARSGEVGVFGSLGLVFCGCAGSSSWFSGWRSFVGAEGLGEGCDRRLQSANVIARLAIAEARGWGAAVIDCWLDGARRLSGARNVLNAWALAAGRPAHAVANLRGVHVELGQSAAEGVAVHAEFFGGLALVALVLRQNFKDVALFELTNGLRVRDAGAVHLRDRAVQFALQGFSSLQFLCGTTTLILPLPERFDPIGRVVLELLGAIQNLLLKVVRYNEGYRMRPGKEIGR